MEIETENLLEYLRIALTEDSRQSHKLSLRTVFLVGE